MTRPTHFALLAALLLLASSALAQTFPAGGGTFSGRGKVKLSGCGKVAGRASGPQYALDAAGVWTESLPGYPSLTGSATPIGTGGRAFSIEYDGASVPTIFQLLMDAGTAMCRETFTPTNGDDTTTLKLNKRLNRAKFRQRVTFSGTTSQGTHNGTISSKEAATWVAAP